MRNNNTKKEKKQIKVDEKLKELERKERENYSSKSWNIRTSGGFYNWGWGMGKTVFKTLQEARNFLEKNDWRNNLDSELARRAHCSPSRISFYREKLGFFKSKLKPANVSSREIKRLERETLKSIMRNKLKKEMARIMKEKYGFFKI